MSHMQREGKTSNNINININLSMKDSVRPAGKKIQNNIKIGPSAMEAKRMTMLTQRLQERKKQIESYNEFQESEYMKAKMTGYTTKKQRSKTTRQQPDQIITAFSTTNAKGKFNSRDVKQVKDTPVKVKKEEEVTSKKKKNMSIQKMKSRRNSKNCSSTDNLKKVKINRSPAKSESKSNSKQRSSSNRKIQVNGIKKNPKLTLDPPKATTLDVKTTIYSNPGNTKNSKSKSRLMSNRGNDDVFIKKAPEPKKSSNQKSSINVLIDNPMTMIRTPHIRKSSNNNILVSKSTQKRKASPSKKKLTKTGAAIKIQKIWKGYWTRKNFLSQIESIVKNNRKVKQMILNNSQRFWQDSSTNSIKFIDVNIQDSFVDKGRPSLELFSGQQVMSLDGSSGDLNPFDRLIKMSQKVGDQKLAKQLRDMAQNLLKQDLQKKKVIRQNRQLKQDIIQLKQQSIHHNVPIPLILPQHQFDSFDIDEQVIIMPVKLEAGDKVSITEKTQKIYNFQKKEKKQFQTIEYEDSQKQRKNQEAYNYLLEKTPKVQKAQIIKIPQILKKEEKLEQNYIDQSHNLAEWNSAKSGSQEQQIQKKRLIEQLKSFKGQSDSMMKKIGKNEKQSSHLPNLQKQKVENPLFLGKNQPKKGLQLNPIKKQQPVAREFWKPQPILDYQMNNQSSDSEQFKQAIRKSEIQSRKRQLGDSSEFFNQQKQKQIVPSQKKELIKPPQIAHVAPGERQHSENSQESHQHGEIQKQVQKKGFQTNLNFVKQYCIGLCEYVRGSEDVKARFKDEVVKPIDLKILNLLASYRKTVNNQQNNQYNSFKYDYVYPYYREAMNNQGLIKFQTFEKFNETLPTLKRNSGDASPQDIHLQSIHLKSLLDVFNQSLNHERPSGVYGQGLPWAPRARNLKNISSTFDEGPIAHGEQYGKQNQKFDQLFGVSIARVIQWGSSLCGFIPESIDISADIHIDEQYISHIKQTRMALMLEKTLAQEEEKMLQFTDVETQVKLQIGMRIIQDLIMEALEQIWSGQLQDNFQYLQ